MAGIEKVCEFSDEYIGPDMYEFKRNHIQIHPRYRKNFRGAKHTLYIESVKPYWRLKGGGITEFDKRDMDNYEPPFENVHEYIDYIRYFNRWRLVKEVSFSLKVDDPELAGNVEGNYREWTTDFTSLKRRLKRMLRCKELNIVDFTNPGNARNAFEAANNIFALPDFDAKSQGIEQYLKTLFSYVETAIDRHRDGEIVSNAIRYGDAQWSAFVKKLQSYNGKDTVTPSGLEFKYIVSKEFPEQAEQIEWDELTSIT